MRRALLGGLLAGGLMVAGSIWLLSTREPPPEIPADGEHVGARREGDCIVCHNVDGPAPRSKNHPLSEQCFQCHLRPGSR